MRNVDAKLNLKELKEKMVITDELKTFEELVRADERANIEEKLRKAGMVCTAQEEIIVNEIMK